MKHCATFTTSMQLELYLEFISDQSSLFVHTVKLYGLPSDYVLVSENIMSNVRVTGTLWPQLKFKCPNLYVKNLITTTKFPLHTSHSLGRMLAFQLKRKIRKPYACRPVFVQNGIITRVPIVRDELNPQHEHRTEITLNPNDFV